MGEGKTMKLDKKLIAVPAIALAAGLSLTACGSSGGSSSGGGGSSPATAAASQTCAGIVGTGAIVNASILDGSKTFAGSDGSRFTGCTLTFNDGSSSENAQVTLFANGNEGWTPLS